MPWETVIDIYRVDSIFKCYVLFIKNRRPKELYIQIFVVASEIIQDHSACLKSSVTALLMLLYDLHT